MRDRFLRAIAETSARRPGRTLAVALGLTLAVGALVPGLDIDASHSGLYDPSATYVRDNDVFLKRYGSPNQLVVMVEGGDEAGRRRVIDAALEALPANGDGVCVADGPPGQPGCVAEVVGRIDADRLGERALLYLPTEALRSLVARLSDPDYGVELVYELTGLSDLFSTAADWIEGQSESVVPDGESAKAGREAMDFVARALREITARVRADARGELSFEQALFERSGDAGVDTHGYLSSDDGAIKLALVRAVIDTDRPEHVVPFVGFVSRRMKAAAAGIDPGLKVTLTGLPAVIADEAMVLGGDLWRTGALATVGLLLVLVLGFGSFAQSLLSLVPLAFTLVWTLAFTRVVFGGLNLVTAAIVPILLGLCVDFAVHLLSRYNEARGEGLDVEAAAVAAVVGVGPGMLTGALTSSGAFVALATSDFPGFREMGVITGFGLVVALVLTLSVIPALLCHPRLPFFRRRARTLPGAGLAAVPGAVVRMRVPILVGGALLAAFTLWASRAIAWSYDYAELLPQDTESTASLRYLTAHTDFSAEVAATEVRSIEQARSVGAALAALPTVARTESLANYLPGAQPEKLAELRKLAPVVETPLGVRKPLELAALRGGLQALADAIDDAVFDARRAGSEHADLLDAPRAALADLSKALEETPPEAALPRLRRLQETVLDARDRALRLLGAHVEAEPMTPGDLLARLPTGMRTRLANPDGGFAVYIYPTDPIGDRAYLTRLVGEMRSVAPRVTGLPVTHLESMDAIRVGFREAALLALGLVLLLLLLDFRSLRYALLAAIPLGIGIAWTWGAITAAGIPYNAGNVVALPLLIGIAVDSGVHILHRFRQEREADVPAVVRHTGRAVTLSGLTTMVGFGALMVARHASMNSFGMVLVFGVSSCLLSAVVFLPALLHVVARPPDTG